jgi:hypothetical protein
MQSTYKQNVHVRALTGLHILVTPSRDWYLYGLMITETKMVKAFFNEAENAIEQLVARLHTTISK